MKPIYFLLLVIFPFTSFAQWTTSGSNIFNSNTGNVGIGTSSPVSKLHLNGLNVTFRMHKSLFTGTESSTKGRLEIKADAADQGLTALVSADRFGTTDEDLIYTLQQPIGNSVSWGVIESWRGAGLLVSASGPDLKPLLFGIDRVEKARLHSNGNFGIGTSTPAFKLDVNGIINATALYVNGAPLSGGFSQWVTGGSNINFTTGNVGIGTTSPAYKLDVSGPINASALYVSGNVGIGTTSPAYKLDVGGIINASGLYVNGVPFVGGSQWTTSGSNINFTNGNVGIGITSPTYKLDVGGVINASAIYVNGAPFVGSSQWTTSGTNINYANGNVGIGTTAPDSKLTVKGTIHTQEVKVDLNVPGPDYVFNDDYKLLSLAEIKTYIDKNKHLPEVPSAKEMEANGVNLGEMNMLLLKKIEELTLHILEQEERIKSLEKVKK